MSRFKSSVWLFSAIIISNLLVFSHKVEICEAVAPSSLSIKLENGRYNGVLIGIDGEKPADCSSLTDILQKLERILSLFSEYLYQATEGRAALGQVNILLPLEWDIRTCKINISDAATSDTYHSSHIQISKNHPMTSDDSLPWTKQYRSCGQPSDSIIFPLPLLLSSSENFPESIKAQLLLHEWVKFRYGAFDEIGYDDDDDGVGNLSFSPCYTFDKQAHLTCCSNSPTLSAVAANESVCSSQFFSGYMATLRQHLEQGSTSIMSSPYLPTVLHFCNNSTHNPWSLTKQNAYCDRQSVAHVVFSHPDFQTSPPASSSASRQNTVPTINITEYGSRRAAYAFVIETSSATIQHVKQAFAQILEIFNTGTNVYLFLYFGGSVNDYNLKTLNGDSEKINLLNSIPSVKSKYFRNLSSYPSTYQSSDLLSPVIQNVVEKLSIHTTVSWNVLLFSGGSTPVSTNDMSAAIKSLQNTSHSISIFTFENNNVDTSSSPPWLLWYGIPNTRNVMPVPYCEILGVPCSFRPASFIMDHLVGILNDQHFGSRLVQSPTLGQQMGIQNQAGQRLQFSMQRYETGSVKRAYIFLSIPENTIADLQTYIQLTFPNGGICTAEKLLGYNSVIKFGGADCTPLAVGGQWSLDILQKFNSAVDILYLSFWVELEEKETFTRLSVTPSLGMANPTTGILPNSQLIPIYVAIQTPQGFPVLDAQVTLQIFHPFQLSEQAGKQLVLRDNGTDDGSDQTENDGVYSAYLSEFSPDQSAHLVQLQIATTAETRILTKIEPPKAILMDETMTRKCCGKRIRVLESSPVQPEQIKFQAMHLGFRTSEGWNGRSLIPPGTIGDVLFNQSDTSISIEFLAVAGGGGDISAYQACCLALTAFVRNDTLPPGASSCKEDTLLCSTWVSPGSRQTCSADKQQLVNTWVEQGQQVITLQCGVRAVNQNFEYGQVSQGTFTVNVESIVSGLSAGNGEQNCEKFSLSDKCLPMWIFWVMIGCLALLVLVMLIMICCYCWRRSKKSKGKNENVVTPTTPAPTTRENVLAVHYPSPSQQPRSRTPDVNVNRHKSSPPAYYNNNSNPAAEDAKVVKELFINKAYIHDGEGEIKIIADNGQILKKPKNENIERAHQQPSPSRMMENNGNNINMQVFKPTPMPTSIPPNRPSRPNQSRGGERTVPVRRGRPEIIHPNPMLRSDSAYEDSRMPSPPPVVVPPSPPSHSSADPALVYATISRRYKPPSQNVKQVAFDPHYQVPHNSVPVSPPHTSQRQKGIINRDPPLPRYPPPQMPEYPTTTTMSDSETSTDYGHHQNSRRREPPRFTKPPAYPAGSQLVNNSYPHQNNQRAQQQPQQFGTRSILVQSPPVPPPRGGTLKSSSPGPAGGTFTGTQDFRASTDDDDSDEWDDGDHTYGGVSYA